MALIAQSQRQTPAAPTGSHPATPLRKLKFQALGTVCEVQYVAPNGDAQATEFERAAVAWVESTGSVGLAPPHCLVASSRWKSSRRRSGSSFASVLSRSMS